MNKIGSDQNQLVLDLYETKTGLKPEKFISISAHGQPLRIWANGCKTVSDIDIEVYVLLNMNQVDELIATLQNLVMETMANHLEEVFKIPTK